MSSVFHARSNRYAVNNLRGLARYSTLLVFLVAIAASITLLTALSFGSVAISINQSIAVLSQAIFSSDPLSTVEYTIVIDIRLPQLIMAFITGSGLAMAGVVLQTITRNPLADPYLFGISSGSALGAVIVLALLPAAAISLSVGALIGGLLAVVLMLSLAGKNMARVESLVLSGVAVSFMLSSVTGIILYYSSPETTANLIFWLMGSISNISWSELTLPVLTLIACFIIFVIFQRWLSALQTGDESAHALGVPVKALRIIMLVTCSLITAVIVAKVGGIGFVGLMIPHISRFLVGAQFIRLLMMSSVLGGLFMMWVHVIAQSALTDQILPVGIVTSAIGSIFFFIILKSRGNQVV
ncbi:MAG: iron ABC transporter permease [Kangiellaceae bacterium]|nr:iron ABC transporter permease [Kangiellaceae bacterium]